MIKIVHWLYQVYQEDKLMDYLWSFLKFAMFTRINSRINFINSYQLISIDIKI